MLAVAMNIFKRWEIGYKGADNICEVVNSPYQYSYLWDGKSHVVLKQELELYNEVYNAAYDLVRLAAVGQLPDYSIGHCEGGATHYHKYDISPRWADPSYGSMREICGRVGKHIFYNGY